MTQASTSSNAGIRYWLGDYGTLWRGPANSEGNLHYAMLEGKQSDGSPCWVLRRSDPDDRWMEITEANAVQVIAAMLRHG
jgi:hypothetical protein